MAASSEAAAGAANVPKPKINQIVGMQRCSTMMALVTYAKKEYNQVMEKLEKEGFTSAYSDESARSREEYSRVIKHPLMEAVHADVAKRALGLARANGGIYNKAAQFIASLQAGAGDTGIPPAYVEELRACTDQCPPRPLAAFAEMIREDLGGTIEELFESVTESPIGAASLAQVHQAVTKGGKEIALKLQYPGLRDQLATDFSVFRAMSGMLKGWTMGIDINMILTDFEKTVTRELDFLAEAENGERTRQSLRHRHPRVLVPGTVREFSSSRILAMEFVSGMVSLRPTRLQQIALSPAKVSQLVCDTFAEMACCHGRVHGDPHGGNVYARQLPGAATGTPQLVLLDHGVYHQLSDEMRVDVCELFLACASRRRKEINRLSEKFAGPLGRFFPLVLSPWFIFGAPVTFSDIRAAKRRQMPPDVSLKQVGETLVKLYEGGGKVIGLLHSLGYTRGLLQDLECSERQRLTSLVCAARLGLQDERYRAGVADVKGAAPEMGAPLRPLDGVLAPPLLVKFGMWWAVLQVGITSFWITILWPIARWMEPKRKASAGKKVSPAPEDGKQKSTPAAAESEPEAKRPKTEKSTQDAGAPGASAESSKGQ